MTFREWTLRKETVQEVHTVPDWCEGDEWVELKQYPEAPVVIVYDGDCRVYEKVCDSLTEALAIVTTGKGYKY